MILDDYYAIWINNFMIFFFGRSTATPRNRCNVAFWKGHDHKSILSHTSSMTTHSRKPGRRNIEKKTLKIYRKFYVSHGTVHTKNPSFYEWRVFYVALCAENNLIHIFDSFNLFHSSDESKRMSGRRRMWVCVACILFGGILSLPCKN
jgi:hypothetical protein